ncbi:hypothetical protein V6N11_052516 [Hibiscus sabdariffa]|uniref:Uncharacterized protein n=1 Tax=Hibiscus sabdariffa TaxID=183260 RepID=A0ABR2UA93_9ROSI
MVERSLSMRELHFESVFGLEVLELNETSAASKSFGRDQRNPLLALIHGCISGAIENALWNAQANGGQYRGGGFAQYGNN